MELDRQRRKQQDRRAGEIVALLFNANRDTAKADPMDWTDVFPEWKEPVREQTEDEMVEMMQLMVERTKGLPA